MYLSSVQEAEQDIGDVDEALERVAKLTTRVATHFCENEKTFHLDEFLESLREFCEKVKQTEQVSSLHCRPPCPEITKHFSVRFHAELKVLFTNHHIQFELEHSKRFVISGPGADIM